jgi:hypothetical protein
MKTFVKTLNSNRVNQEPYLFGSDFLQELLGSLSDQSLKDILSRLKTAPQLTASEVEQVMDFNIKHPVSCFKLDMLVEPIIMAREEARLGMFARLIKPSVKAPDIWVVESESCGASEPKSNPAREVLAAVWKKALELSKVLRESFSSWIREVAKP